MCGVMGIEPGWDCGQFRLDELNGFLLYCRDSMKVLVTTLPEGRGSFGESAKKLHQNVAWSRGCWL